MNTDHGHSVGLIMVVGLPGTGKSTFARALAERTGAVHLNTDVIRQELGLRSRYRPEDKQRVYRELLHRTERALSSGKSAIVDATLYLERLRMPYRALARKMNCPISWIQLQTSPAVVRERLIRPRQYSEADFSVYTRIQRAYEPLADPHLGLPSDRLSQEEMVDLALQYVASV
ncbi:hypothetical protein GGR26_002971 [Lewinella marina]|nr:ATP-binding protein [Neolewinella marina]NJB87194.1 hypothetical protein [Neolewinella marina]